MMADARDFAVHISMVAARYLGLCWFGLYISKVVKMVSFGNFKNNVRAFVRQTINDTSVRANIGAVGAFKEDYSVRPRPGAYAMHDIVPDEAALIQQGGDKPRADDLGKKTMSMAQAEEYVGNLERPMTIYPNRFLHFSSKEDKDRYIKAAARAVTGALGVGRGKKKFAKSDWARASRPHVPEDTHKEGGFVRAKIDPKWVDVFAWQKHETLHEAGKSRIRQHADAAKTINSYSTQAFEVGNLIRSHIQKARVDQIKEFHVLIDAIAEAHVLRKKLHKSFKGFVLLNKRTQDAKETCRKLEVQIAKLECLSVVNKAKWAAAVDEMPHDLPTDISKVQIRIDQSKATLNRLAEESAAMADKSRGCAESVLAYTRAVSQAELDLKAAQRAYRLTMPLSLSRRKAKQEITQRQTQLNDVQKLLQQAQTFLEPMREKLLKNKAKIDELRHLHESFKGYLELLDYAQNKFPKLVELRAELKLKRAIFNDIQSERNLVYEEYKKCRLEERTFLDTTAAHARRNSDFADNHLHELENILPRMGALRARYVQSREAIHLSESTARFEDAQSAAGRTLSLCRPMESFWSFDLTSDTGIQFHARMRLLRERILAPHRGMTPDQFERSFSMPGEQALEVVVRAINIAAQGNVDAALTIATALHERKFADLVPQPTVSGLSESKVAPDVENPIDAAIRLIANRPSGIDVLDHACAPPESGNTSEDLHTAVLVYFRASEELLNRPPKDAASLAWLHKAQEAAQLLAHRPAQCSFEEKYKSLEREQRVAFNGVRNKLLSIAPESTYQNINDALKDVTQKFVSKTDRVRRSQANPLRARELASEAVADAGLPGAENMLGKQIHLACGALLSVVALEQQRLVSHANGGRMRAAGINGVKADLDTIASDSEALAVIQLLLLKIDDHYSQGKRTDTLVLNSGFWRSIEKKITTEITPSTWATFKNKARPSYSDRYQLKARHAVQGLRDAVKKIEDPSMIFRPEVQIRKKDLNELLDDLRANPQTVLKTLHTLQKALVPAKYLPFRKNKVSKKTDAKAKPSSQELAGTPGYVAEPGAPDSAMPHSKPGSKVRFAVDENNQPLLFPLPTQGKIQSENSLAVAGVSSFSSSDEDSESKKRLLLRLREEAKAPYLELFGALDSALAKADQYNAVVSDFVEKPTADNLLKWALPQISPVFGQIYMSDGDAKGVTAGNLVSVATTLATGGLLTVKPTADWTQSSRTQVHFGRDARRLTFMTSTEAGDNKNAGLGLGSSTSFWGLNPLKVGAMPSMAGGRSKFNVHGGAVINSPRMGHVGHPQAIREFAQSMITAFKWNQPFDSTDPKEKKDTGAVNMIDTAYKDVGVYQGDQAYEDPIVAILDRHPRASVGSIESLSSTVNTSGTGVSATGRAGPPLVNVNGSLGLMSRRMVEERMYKTEGGAQTYVQRVRATNNALGATAVGGLGMGGVTGVKVTETGQAAGPDVQTHKQITSISGNVAGVSGSMGLHQSLYKSGITIIGAPDGSMIAERAQEFNNFQELLAAVTPHRQAWIRVQMNKFKYPDSFGEVDKYILAERAFDDFLAKSEQNLAAGTHTLQSNLDVKPHVGAQLSGYKAIEELGFIQADQMLRNPEVYGLRVAMARAISSAGGPLYTDPVDDALADAHANQRMQYTMLRETDAYQPFLIRSFVRSVIGKSKGANFGIAYKKDTVGIGQMTADRYPDSAKIDAIKYYKPASERYQREFKEVRKKHAEKVVVERAIEMAKYPPPVYPEPPAPKKIAYPNFNFEF
jgi:hypothetical protein